MLIADEPKQVLDKEHQTELPRIVGWNLIWLSYNTFIKKYGTTGFDSFVCPEGVNPLLFSQLCIFTILMYERTKHWEKHIKSCSNKLNIISPQREMICLKKDQQNFRGKGEAMGQITIASKQNPVSVPSNLVITVPGWINKIPPKITCLVEQAQHHNLPLGIVINRCVATTKVRSVPVILINTTKQNVWIWQPLLAAELFIMDQIDKIEHRASMERKGDNINISFSPVTPDTIRVQSKQIKVTPSDITPPISSDKPSFGPRPDINIADFDFQAEINHITCLSN